MRRRIALARLGCVWLLVVIGIFLGAAIAR